MKEQDQFKYFAFISYSSKDAEWGKRLQRKLEHYRMPATLCSEHGWERTPIKPVFFAPTDIQPGGLTEELQERLRASRNLIVICSPNSAQSEWVGKEIEFFHDLGRTKQIHFFIVDGVPHSSDTQMECFNPIIDTLDLPEMLGANIHERTQSYPFTRISWPWMDKQRAYVQLISKLLGVEFDSIWQRHKRLLIQKSIAWIFGIITILVLLTTVWVANLPVDVNLRLQEATVHNPYLPPLKDAVVSITLENEVKTDTIHSLDDVITLRNIPHRFIGKKVLVKFVCKDYIPFEMPCELTKSMDIAVCRDTTIYGSFRFKLWNPDAEEAMPNTKIMIDRHLATSDSNGYVSMSIPLSEQKEVYPVSASINLIDSIIVVPCGPNGVVRYKQ